MDVRVADLRVECRGLRVLRRHQDEPAGQAEDEQPHDCEQEGETPVDPVDHCAPPIALKPAVTVNASPRDSVVPVVLPLALDTSVTFVSQGRLASRSRMTATVTCEDATPDAVKPDAAGAGVPGAVAGAGVTAPDASGVGDCADRLCR